MARAGTEVRAVQISCELVHSLGSFAAKSLPLTPGSASPATASRAQRATSALFVQTGYCVQARQVGIQVGTALATSLFQQFGRKPSQTMSRHSSGTAPNALPFHQSCTRSCARLPSSARAERSSCTAGAHQQKPLTLRIRRSYGRALTGPRRQHSAPWVPACAPLQARTLHRSLSDFGALAISVLSIRTVSRSCSAYASHGSWTVSTGVQVSGGEWWGGWTPGNWAI